MAPDIEGVKHIEADEQCRKSILAIARYWAREGYEDGFKEGFKLGKSHRSIRYLPVAIAISIIVGMFVGAGMVLPHSVGG